jgi:hypothetical protein
VEGLGVGDGEQMRDALVGKIVGVGEEIRRQRHRAERHQLLPRKKNAAEERIRHRRRDSASILRGTRSPIQSFVNALAVRSNGPSAIGAQ